MHRTLGNFHVFVYENDSDDCTSAALMEWQLDDPSRIHLLSEKLSAVAPRGTDHNRRIQMIAQFRNRVLRMLKEHDGPKFDYVWVIDWDMKPWKAEIVVKAFEEPEPWDMVCTDWKGHPTYLTLVLCPNLSHSVVCLASIFPRFATNGGIT